MHWDESISHSRQLTAIELLRKATAVQPDKIHHWENLASLLLDTGRTTEAVTILNEALLQHPSSPSLQITLADAYVQMRRNDLARKVIDSSIIPTEDRKTTIRRLELLMMLGQPRDAHQAAIEALALDPVNNRALRVLGQVSRGSGNPETMLPLCRLALKHDPESARAHYELAVALAMLGQCKEARALMKLEELVCTVELDTPNGYKSSEAFEAALASELLNNPTLSADPVNKATAGGFQTQSGLPHGGDPATAVAIDMIRSAIEGLAATSPSRCEAVFMRRCPGRVRIDAWGVVYPGGGRQVSHIHPAGWLSGVYYVSTPPPSPDAVRAGCLLVGTLDIDGTDPPWGVLVIHPKPGRMVTFPSYVPHSTVPTDSNVARICIAFDVIPVG